MGSSSSWSTPAFGSSTSTPTFGSSPFPSFGSPTSTPAFGSPTSTPAFGSYTSPAFGSYTSTPAFGSSMSTPAFGSSTSTLVFGSYTSPAFGSFTPTPVFGSSTSTATYGRPTDMFRPAMPRQAPVSSPAFGATTGHHSSSVTTFGVSSMPSPFGSFDRVSEKGSRVSAYSKTADGDASYGGDASYDFFQSISAMPVYNSKSHEELRHEDYQRGDKGSSSMQESMVSSGNRPWEPQPPVKPLTHVSEAHVKPSVGLQSTNPFWLRSVGPQPSLFSSPPQPIHKPLFSTSSSATSTTCLENKTSNTAAYTAPSDASFTEGHMLHQNFSPAKSTHSGGSLLSSSVTHSAPAPSPNGQCTTIKFDHPNKTVELLLPIDITTLRIRFCPRNDDAGSLDSQVHGSVQASATPVTFSIYPGENQELTIRSGQQPTKSQTGKTSSSTRFCRTGKTSYCSNFLASGLAGEQKRNSCDVPLTERSPFGTPGCKVINESVLPRLYKADYYTFPSIAELAARERQEPGCCSHVKDFTVGRHGYGSVKFDGETDVRMLDITSIMEFKDREINVYTDESKKPPVGKELNKPAEITLLNVKCVDQKTGLQLMEGPAVDAYKGILTQWTKDKGAEFISFDAVKGEWKFRVKHL